MHNRLSLINYQSHSSMLLHQNVSHCVVCMGKTIKMKRYQVLEVNRSEYWQRHKAPMLMHQWLEGKNLVHIFFCSELNSKRYIEYTRDVWVANQSQCKGLFVASQLGQFLQLLKTHVIIIQYKNITEGCFNYGNIYIF